MKSLTNLYQRHHNFILLLCLFISFRALVVLAFRPGGFVLDFSDFYFYRVFAEVSREGYIVYENLWTTYPPLFPWLMINIWELSALLPPWEFNNLWFNLFLSATFLLFEAGNFILLYLMALKLYSPQKAFKSAWIYALLFAPVYTLTGWFESYPLFFFLLSLYLLLCGKPYWAALSSGLGFMVKLIPIILLPIGAKHLPIYRDKWRLVIPWLQVDLDLTAFGRYLLTFGLTIFFIGLPWYLRNPDLILAPFFMTGFRPAWQTIWALLEGNYDYGVIPVDMRNLDWASLEPAPSSLPWLWITLGFAIIYTLLFTRKVAWKQPKVTLAFTGLTVCFFFLYSKGYSPQWLGWLFVFIALLLPNARGVFYALLLDGANIIESNFFITIFPDEIWLLQSTVLLRTLLIVVLGTEYSLLIWPNLDSVRIVAWRRYALVFLALGLVMSLPFGLIRLGQAYFDLRLVNSPYRNSITWLKEQPVKEAIILNSHDTYDWYYPYLRQSHEFYMLDSYENAGLTERTQRLMAQIAAEHQALWVYDSDPENTTPAETSMQVWLADSQLAHQADIDGGRLYLYIFPERSP